MSDERTPTWRRYLRFWGADAAADTNDEIDTHLALRIEDNLARGMSPEAARGEALARFGDVERVRRDCQAVDREREHDVRRAELFGILRQDVRYALRTLRRAPGFTLVAVLSLALGIGANAALVGMLDAVVLRPLPGVSRPAELVDLSARSLSYPAVRALRAPGGPFADVAGYRVRQMATGAGDEARLRPVGIVSANYFTLLGARAALGRTFLPAEDRAGARAPVAVLGHRVWRREFGGDPGVIGRTVRLNGAAFTIVGVAEPGFRGTRLSGAPDLWIPIESWPLTAVGELARLDIDDAGWGWLNTVARLPQGGTLAQARARLDAFVAAREAGEPELVGDLARVQLTPAAAAAVQLGSSGPTAAPFVLLLGGVVGIALLIACLNVAGLLLARAARRQKEIGVRLALGAGRARLVRQLLTESLVVALLGAAAAVLVAAAGTRLLATVATPLTLGAAVDGGLTWRTVAACGALALLAALVVGLVPALQASRPDVVGSLKEVGAAPRRARVRLRSVLVAAQLALALLLLAGAGLFVRSLRASLGAETGYATERLATARLDLAFQRYDSTRARQFYDALRARLASRPDVEGVSFALTVPLVGGADGFGFRFPAQGADTARRATLAAALVGADYFRTLGLPLVRGRAIEAADLSGPDMAVVVNETLARRYWPARDAVGRRFLLGDQPLTVVGVARDATYESLGEPPMPFVYLPLRSDHPRYADHTAVLVRTSGDPAAAVPLVRAAVQALDPAVPVLEATTYEAALGELFLMQRVAALLFGAFAVLTLVLAAVGIYGVMAYLVAQRTREIGIRIALGAGRARVLGQVLGRSATLVGAGLAVGLALAAIASRLVAGFLYGVDAGDPVVLGGSAIVLGATAAIAALVPARRASRVDPTTALRSE